MNKQKGKIRMKDLVQFDKAKNEVVTLTAKLDGFVITDVASRDILFNLAKESNRVRKLIDNKRLEITEPFRTEKTRIIAEHKKEKTDLDEKIKLVDNYAKNDIAGPLEVSIATAKSSIIHFDGEEAKRKAEAQKKIDDEKIRIEKELKEEEEKAKAKTGIAAKIALKKVEVKSQHAMDAVVFQQKAIDTKPKGREVEVATWELFNIRAVPKEFLVVNIDKSKIQKSIDAGEKNIPGIKITYKKEMRFQ